MGSRDIVGGVGVLEGGDGEGSKEGDSLLGSSSSNGSGMTGVPAAAAAVAAAIPPATAPSVDGADWDVDWEALTRMLGLFLECRVVVLMLRDDRRNALLCRAAAARAARAARAPRCTVFPRTFLCQSGGGGGGFGGGGRVGKGGVGGMLQGVAGRYREGLFIFPTPSTVRDIVEQVIDSLYATVPGEATLPVEPGGGAGGGGGPGGEANKQQQQQQQQQRLQQQEAKDRRGGASGGGDGSSEIRRRERQPQAQGAGRGGGQGEGQAGNEWHEPS